MAEEVDNIGGSGAYDISLGVPYALFRIPVAAVVLLMVLFVKLVVDILSLEVSWMVALCLVSCGIFRGSSGGFLNGQGYVSSPVAVALGLANVARLEIVVVDAVVGQLVVMVAVLRHWFCRWLY